MSELKPEDKKLHRVINKAMEDDDFYDTILEAAQAKQITELQSQLATANKEIERLKNEYQRCKDDCWPAELRLNLAEKDKEIERLNTIIHHRAEDREVQAKYEAAQARIKSLEQPYKDIRSRIKEIKFKPPLESEIKLTICEDILTRIERALKEGG